MRWNDYPIIRLVIPFILGIISYTLSSDYWTHSLIAIATLGFLLILFSYFRKLYLPYKYRFITGGIIYLQLFLLGIISAQFHYPYNAENYYGKNIKNSEYIIAKVIDSPKATPRSIKLIVEIVVEISDSVRQNTTGKSILYLRKNAEAQSLKYGDILICRNHLKLVKKPMNPYEFDYGDYLKNKGIRYSSFLRETEWKKMGESDEFSLKKGALIIRNKILKQFEENGLHEDEYAVASSLILGYRDELSDDLMNAYRSAGVMHVLCVSGMHVGIIYLIISYLLGFLKRKKWGMVLRLFIILINVWGFAIITGLSPSVTRAAVMFTFVSIGQNIGRKINIYNTLAASAFITLIFSPYSLFEIGFLLSYAAVISIAALYKPIYSIWVPYNKIINFFWQIAAVSIAAQIGTSPFLVYFFHQFPNYFLISNLVVIMAITPIFYLVLASLIFSFYPPVAQAFSFVATWIIRIMNGFITSVQSWPFAVTENIHFSLPALFLIIALVLSICLIFLKRKMVFVYASYVSIIGLLGLSIHSAISENRINQMVFFNTSGHSAVLFHQGENSLLALDSSAFYHPELIEFQTKGYIKNHGLSPKTINLDSILHFDGWVSGRNNILIFNNQIIAFLPHGNHIKYNKSLKCNHLIIRDKKTYYLPEFMSFYKSENIVLSSELWPGQADRFAKGLKEKGLDFYNLKQSQALIVEF